jgi:hypothetical protein
MFFILINNKKRNCVKKIYAHKKWIFILRRSAEKIDFLKLILKLKFDLAHHKPLKPVINGIGNVFQRLRSQT